jgi:hypothetical protein
MWTIRYSSLPLGALCLVAFTTNAPAKPTLGEAVRAADAKYLEAPERGTIDNSPKIMAGGGEDGLPPADEELSQGRLRVTLTYVEEEPREATGSLDEEPPGETDDVVAPPDEDQALEDGEGSLEDIPEEAMLPGEFDLGEEVWRAPVVTVIFDNPNPKPADTAAEQSGDAPAATSRDGVPADTAERGAPPPGAAEPVPTGPRTVAELRGPSVGTSNPPVSIQIAELDPSNAHPEVVVSFFTGGAHCCSLTSVVTSNEDGSVWTTVEVGEFDGGPLLAVDLDGDGVYEFETRDNAFLYAFACYACSQAPLQVLALDGTEIKDVSADPRFKPAHSAWIKNMIVGVPEQEVNGFLAGYVAEKIRLGEGKQAWTLMKTYYDRDTDWGLEICDVERSDCPGAVKKLSFPKALELMLKKNGYKIGG